MPTHRSLAITRAPRLAMQAVGLACLLTALCVSCAAAQARRAAIRVNVMVLDFAASDVLGAHAVGHTVSDASLGAERDSDTWRVTSGLSPELSLQAERIESGRGLGQAPRVAICEAAPDAAVRCRDQHLPALQVGGGPGSPDLLVRFRREAGADARTPVRLTLAYTGT